jgi:hypothetical protein
MQRNVWYCPRNCVELRTVTKNLRIGGTPGTDVNSGPLKYKAGLLCMWFSQGSVNYIHVYPMPCTWNFSEWYIKVIFTLLSFVHNDWINQQYTVCLWSRPTQIEWHTYLKPGRSRFKDAAIEGYVKWFKAQHLKYSKGTPFTLQWGWDTTFFCRYSWV